MFVPAGLTGLENIFNFVATLAFIIAAYLLIRGSRIKIQKSGRFFTVDCTPSRRQRIIALEEGLDRFKYVVSSFRALLNLCFLIFCFVYKL